MAEFLLFVYSRERSVYFDKLYDSAFNLSYIWKLGLQELKIRYVLFIQVFTFFVFIQVFRQFRVIFELVPNLAKMQHMY